jgi:hypothetical protein
MSARALLLLAALGALLAAAYLSWDRTAGWPALIVGGPM